jgi:hypothetical protein
MNVDPVRREAKRKAQRRKEEEGNTWWWWMRGVCVCVCANGAVGSVVPVVTIPRRREG